MTGTIWASQLDATHLTVRCSEKSIAMDLREHFSFDIPGAKYSPRFKEGYWDGKIRLYNNKDQTLYVGLLAKLFKFSKSYGCELDYSKVKASGQPATTEEIERFFDSLQLPSRFEKQDFQIAAVKFAVNTGRALLLSPTSSGKSLILYLLTKWYGKKTCIITTQGNLVRQLTSDFKQFGCDPDDIHSIEGGERWTEKPITITTYHSAADQEQAWYDQFDVVLADEVHLFKSATCKKIMESLNKCWIKIGMTGSLTESKTDHMVLEGLFGPPKKVITTKELMDRGFVSPLDIKIMLIEHPDEIRKLFWIKSKIDYETEYKFLIGEESRNRAICNLAIAKKGNTLVLFTRKEDHGYLLRGMMEEYLAGTGREFIYIDGDISKKEEEHVRERIEALENGIVLATYGKFSTGISINRIHNIILASPYKAKVKILQSLGRGLRKSPDKKKLRVYDIADDLSLVKKNKRTGAVSKKANHTLLHMIKRVEIYAEEQFDYEIKKYRKD